MSFAVDPIRSRSDSGLEVTESSKTVALLQAAGSGEVLMSCPSPHLAVLSATGATDAYHSLKHCPFRICRLVKRTSGAFT